MKQVKTYLLAEMKNRYIGKRGTMGRERYEIKLAIKLFLQRIGQLL